MGLIVERSQQFLEDKGPLSFGFYTSGQLFLEEYYTLGVIGPGCPFPLPERTGKLLWERLESVSVPVRRVTAHSGSERLRKYKTQLRCPLLSPHAKVSCLTVKGER